MKSEFAVLILSCDKYSDLWEPFFSQFWKNWPNCPYKVYLGSNEVVYKKDKRVITLQSGKDLNWSSSYKKILEQIPEEHVFVWLEDAFLTKSVNVELFAKCFNLLKNKSARHIHFRPVPKPDSIVDEDFGKYLKGMPYAATVMGFWNKEYLKRILLDGENAWNFEIMGSYRASFDEGFYCLLNPVINYIHLVEKGKWIKKGITECEKHNIKLNLNKRKIMPINVVNVFKDFYFGVMVNTPWLSRVNLMNTLRRLIISY